MLGWTPLRLWLNGTFHVDRLDQHTVGKYYSESMKQFLVVELNSDAWRDALEESHGQFFPAVIDRILRSVLDYWDAAAPLLDHHRQAFADARRDTQHARQLRREGAIRTLMHSTWVWHVAGEDFKQRQLHAYPLRAVLDAIAAAHASHDARSCFTRITRTCLRSLKTMPL